MNRCTVPSCQSGKYYAKGFCKAHYNHWKAYGDPTIYKKGFTVAEKFWPKVICHGPGQCWEWCGNKHDFGYGMLGLKINGKWKSEGAHRISWRIHKGQIPEGLNVLHSCDNPECTNPNHLFLGTQLDNLQDMLNKGRAKGRLSGMEKVLLCQHPDRPYHAKGKCRKCYMDEYRAKLKEIFR